MVYDDEHLLIVQVKSALKKVNEFVVLVEFNECIYSNVGASTSDDIKECTHVLVEELMPFNEALVDAIVAEKPFVLTSWVEVKMCFIY